MNDVKPDNSSPVDNESRSSARSKNDNPTANGILPKELSEKIKKDIEDLTFNLDSGEKVEIHSFSFSRTYAGLLFGRIDDEEYNNEVFDRASYPKNWGIRKTLKIKPSCERFQKGFKEYCFSVWLTSSIPINSKYDGSELVVIWFDDIAPGESIKEIVQNGVRSIDWNENARDFEI